MPEPGTEPDHPPTDTAHIAIVRWRVRDEWGRGIGQWTLINRYLTIEEAIEYQRIWLTDLDVDVRVPDSGTYAP